MTRFAATILVILGLFAGFSSARADGLPAGQQAVSNSLQQGAMNSGGCVIGAQYMNSSYAAPGGNPANPTLTDPCNGLSMYECVKKGFQ